MVRGIHGEKLIATRKNEKLPQDDIQRLELAVEKYDEWIVMLADTTADTVEDLIVKMIELLNRYKLFIDVDIIFDSPDNFLYRQKGQLKLDNTIIEEFLPIFVKKCIEKELGKCEFTISAQTKIYSSIYFDSNLSTPSKGGGMIIKSKDQDFSISRPLFIRSSFSSDLNSDDSCTINTSLGYVMAELKTNLDKTMFQEASATAHDIKLAVQGAKYFLLCDYLDMTPISTSTTDIDEILIIRKAKRMNSNIRDKFSTFEGRKSNRKYYLEYLQDNPYSVEILTRFVNYILKFVSNEDVIEEDVLQKGYF